MNELIDYTLIENEILKDSISDFLSEIREKSLRILQFPWCENSIAPWLCRSVCTIEQASDDGTFGG